MKRFEEIGEAFIFLFKEYPKKRKDEIKEGLKKYKFEGRKKYSAPHKNSIEIQRRLNSPMNHLEAIIKIMNPYYNARTANNVREYVISNL